MILVTWPCKPYCMMLLSLSGSWASAVTLKRFHCSVFVAVLSIEWIFPIIVIF